MMAPPYNISGSFDPQRIKRLVIHSPNWLGDAMMAMPLVEYLKAQCPLASLTMVTRPAFADIWSTHSAVSEVMCFDRFDDQHSFRKSLVFIRQLRRSNFDAVFILPTGHEFAWYYLWGRVPVRVGYAFDRRRWLLTHSFAVGQDFRSQHLTDRFIALAQVFGATIAGRPTLWETPSEETTKKLTHQYNLKPGRPIVLLHPWATYGPAKRWPIERFAELGKRLMASHGAQVMVIGAHENTNAGNDLHKLMNQRAMNLTGKTTLAELLHLLSLASLVVTTDSGPSHLAGALDVPVLTLFGSSSPTWTRPLGDRSEIIYRDLECSPCFEKTCPLGTYACFDQITVDEVWTRAVEMLMSRTRRNGKIGNPMSDV